MIMNRLDINTTKEKIESLGIRNKTKNITNSQKERILEAITNYIKFDLEDDTADYIDVMIEEKENGKYITLTAKSYNRENEKVRYRIVNISRRGGCSATRKFLNGKELYITGDYAMNANTIEL